MAVPAASPVTIPEEPTDALLLLTDQVPPAGVALSETVLPSQTTDGDGEIAAVADDMLDVTVCVATDEHPVVGFVVVYVIIAVPVVITVATPKELIVAFEVLLHTPPATLAVNVIDAPKQTRAGPVIVAAGGNGFTVTTVIPDAEPQLFVTV